jgi:TadE-like protein
MMTDVARQPNDQRGEQGQAIAEFAIAFPILLMMVLGIVQISLFFVARSVVEYAAYAAARAELVGEDPERAAAFVCSAISGPTYAQGTGTSITVPGWGELPRSESASLKTSVNVLDGIGNESGYVTVEVIHKYELVVPLASLIFSPISEPVKAGEVPDTLFVTENNVPHFVVRARYTRPVPWDNEKRAAEGHPNIPGL